MRRTKSAPYIAYDSAGEAGPRVLMVMGLGMRGAVWKPQIEGLRDTHKLAWLDNRGIGESDLPEKPFTVRDLADDVLRVADELAWDRFHLVGVSFGGMISQEVALAAQARLQSLTLIATHPGGPLGLAPTGSGLPKWFKSAVGSTATRIDQMAKLLYPAEYLAIADRDALRARMRLQFEVMPAKKTSLLQLLAVARHDTRKRLSRIHVPTLVVKPERDELVRPFHSDRLFRGIPSAQLLVIPDAGHGVTFQSAAKLNAAIAEHVARHESGMRAL